MKELLPSMEFEFDFDSIGEETHQKYLGKFKYRRLNIKNRTEQIKMKVKLDESLQIDDELYMLFEMVSWLRFGFVSYPDWWKENDYGLELYDINIITELYKKVNEFENNWSKQLLEKKKDE
jgi:hypothetical protein